MTNKMIIFYASMELMEAGKIGTTGREFVYENEDGEKITAMEPEPIHTYAMWKELGYQVQRGEKAVASFMIWKYATKKAKDDENKPAKADDNAEEESGNMFLKKASFFSLSQVKKVEEQKSA